MTARGLLRILLLLALVPLVLRARTASTPADDDEIDTDAPTDDDVEADADADGAEAVIDINTASREMLVTLPGIGPKHAEDIVANRPYRAKLDLLRRGIVPESTYQAIRDQVIARHRSLEDTEAEAIGSEGHA
jgi:hypothetical protein